LSILFKNFKKNDSAISEIIGVILLVVIVTIIASLTALFVFGYLQGVSKPYIIDFTVQRLNPETVEIMNNGGPNLADLKTSSSYLMVEINGIDATSIAGTGRLDSNVGSCAQYNASTGSQIIIVGLFNDDKNHLLYQGTI
jgi:FlaG/FlaF family flagellin (archaellin)